MSDYIEREAAEKMFEDAQIISDGEYSGYCTEDVNLSNIPAADVAPVRHGRWISTGAISCKCSECHHLELKTRTLEYAYCPACGALMDGKEDGHEAG